MLCVFLQTVGKALDQQKDSGLIYCETRFTVAWGAKAPSPAPSPHLRVQPGKN